MAQKVSSEDVKAVGRLIEALETLRDLDPEMPIQTVLTFLQTAKKEGQSMTDLSKLMGLPISSMSRNLTALAALNRYKQPGLDLVSYESDPMVDARSKAATLTGKGRSVLARLLAPLKR